MGAQFFANFGGMRKPGFVPVLHDVSSVAAGGGGTPNQADKQTSTQEKGTSLPANLWDDPKTENNSPQPQQSQQQVQQPDFNYDNFYKGLNIGQQVDWKKAVESPENLQSAIEQYSKDLFRQSFSVMQQYLSGEMKKVQEQAVNQSRSVNHAEKLIESMHTALPFTRDPNIAPVAKNILQQSLKLTNNDQEKALAMVKAYFADTASKAAPHVGLGFNKSSQGPAKEQDWTAFFEEVAN